MPNDDTTSYEDDTTEVKLAVLDASALQNITKGEIDQQVATAHAYPRILSRFKARLRTFATLNQSTADECIYALPRGGKMIEGPSVRFAEMVAQAWGNLRVATTIMDIGQNAVIVRGVSHDLESNVAYSVEVRRLVQKKKKAKHPDDDDRQLAVAAASAIARRNAIFACVPKSLFAEEYEAAQAAAAGKGTMEQRRGAALAEYHKRHSVQAGDVLAVLGRESVEDLTELDLRQLRGMLNAIKSGELTVEDAMRPKAEREAAERTRVATTPSDIGAAPTKPAVEPKPEPTPNPAPAPTERGNKQAPVSGALDHDPTDPTDSNAP